MMMMVMKKMWSIASMTIQRVLWTQPSTGWGRAAPISYYGYLIFFLLGCLVVIVNPGTPSFDCYFPTSLTDPASTTTSFNNPITALDVETLLALRLWLYRLTFSNYAALVVLCWLVGPTLYAILTLLICLILSTVWNWVCYLSLTVDDPTVYQCFQQDLYIADPIFIAWPLFSLVCTLMERSKTWSYRQTHNGGGNDSAAPEESSTLLNET